MMHNEATEDSMDPANFVTIEVPCTMPGASSSNHSPSDPAAPIQYQVTMEDGDETETGKLFIIH